MKHKLLAISWYIKTLGLETVCYISQYISQCLHGVQGFIKNIRRPVFLWMLENKDTVVQMKESFTLDSAFLLTLQVGKINLSFKFEVENCSIE